MNVIDAADRLRLAALYRGGWNAPAELTQGVGAILHDVRTRGDVALIEHTRRLDDPSFDAARLRVPIPMHEGAKALVPPEIADALRLAKQRVTRFHERQRHADLNYVDEDGTRYGFRYRPLASIAAYVPGNLPSSVIMSVVPAKIAGVNRTVVLTPPQADGRVHPAIVFACSLCEVDELYAVGGAQAIAAAAYGTQSISPVDKIVGPGNAWVTEAKRQVFGVCAIDGLSGPSEVLVVADDGANSEYIAGELLAQAEQDELARVAVVSESRPLLDAVAQLLDTLDVRTLPRGEVMSRSNGPSVLSRACAKPRRSHRRRRGVCAGDAFANGARRRTVSRAHPARRLRVRRRYDARGLRGRPCRNESRASDFRCGALFIGSFFRDVLANVQRSGEFARADVARRADAGGARRFRRASAARSNRSHAKRSVKRLKLVAFDLDGTLVGRDLAVSPRVKEAIGKMLDAGINGCIVTGRMYRAAIPFARELGLTAPIVCYQGAAVIDPETDRILRDTPLPVQTVRRIIDVVENDRMHLQLYRNDEYYCEQRNRFSDLYARLSNVQPVIVPSLRESFAFSPATKAVIITDPPEATAYVERMKETFGNDAYVTRSYPEFVELVNPAVDKGDALRFIADHLGIDTADVAAIGDSWNDAPLLQAAGFGVAMGNAPAELRDVAKAVVSDVAGDGVAEAIERYVLA